MKRKTEVILVVGILIVSSGIVAAATIYGDTSGTVVWDAPNGPEIETIDAEVNESVPIRDGTVDLGHTQFSSSGETAATVDSWDSTYLNVYNLYLPTDMTVQRGGETVTVSGAADSIKIRNGFVLQDVDAVRATVSGETTLTLSTPSTDATYITLVDTDTGETVAATDGSSSTITATISQDRNLKFEAEDVTVTDPDPPDGTLLNQTTDINISADVTHPSTSDGDVTVEFRDAADDSVIATKTISSNGRVSAIWSSPTLGVNDWYINMDDGERQINSSVYSFKTPSTIEFRDEQTNDLLDSGTTQVEVRYFVIGEDNEVVLSDNTSDGTLSLAGLPPDQDLVVDADAEGYVSRSTIIRDIGKQQTVYLLNESATVNSVAFDLQDRTGEFDSETSRVLIRKPIDEDAETVYRTIIGDTFGANDRVEAALEAGERYRIVVENQEGDTRSFGSYVADTPGDVVPLRIGEITIAPPEEDGYVFDARETTVDVDGTERQAIRIVYRDNSETTDGVTVKIFEQRNSSNQIYGPETYQSDNIADTVLIPKDQENVSTWAVEYEINRETDGEAQTGIEMVGELTDVDWPLSTQMLQVVGLGAILLVAGLFGGSLSQIGAVVVVAVSWVLAAIGFVAIPIEFLIAAAVIAVLFLIGRERDPTGGPV